MDNVVAKVRNQSVEGWKKVNVRRSLKSVVGEVRLSVTKEWNEARKIIMTKGEPIVIEIGNECVATGYISEFIPSYDAKEVRYELICHDKTIDLVECSLIHSTGQWNNATLTQLANDVCKPFGIDVVVEANVGAAFDVVRIEHGETVFAFLDRLARQRGVLLTSNAYGNLVITTASTKKLGITLETGKNIRAARGRFSMRERYSDVTVKGDSDTGEFTLAKTGYQAVTEKDVTVPRYRPLIVMLEEPFTAAGASRRGQWHIKHAEAKSNSSEITVTGWRMGEAFNGRLWPMNELVKVIDPIQDINDELLIAGFDLEEGDSGRITVLTVMPPKALEVPIETPQSQDKGMFW
ncbi:phage baseplate assembly protein [Vibrio sp. LaRot3]|uniref:phage baseplate assembly protein n=1 Tax=Vibrio sp. LaRot3 TaxID=2998829 RepID=UPI0022CDDABA|nr:phage tail protein [Vibrio sp. LaRot3]MDA0148860.1 phage tail protein [Vibrio sp. LaRot3]